MINHAKEDALSEVIGFILIIAVITIIASLYMVYVVPAQGREAEIEHMNYVKDQFVDFKIRMDSLWLNNEPNVTVSQNIEMGTLGKKTEGNLVVIPILQPVGSDGEIEVDTGSDPIIKITTNAYATEDITMTADNTIDIEGLPRYSGSGIYPTNIVKINPGPIPTNPPLPSWIITPVNITQPTDEVPWEVYLNVTKLGFSSGNDIYGINMSIVKHYEGETPYVIRNLTIYDEIDKAGGTLYPIDIYDPAFGLNQNYAFTNLTYTVKDPVLGTITEIPGNPTFNTVDTSLVTPWNLVGTDQKLLTTTHVMGNFSYTGNNYYWIPQTYFYQMGGVFLAQDDGMTNKIVPLINLYVEPGTNNPGIRISDLRITGITSTISGTSPVQVLSIVEGTTKNRLPDTTGTTYILADTPNNSDYVEIMIETKYPAMQKLWYDTFQQIKYAATVSGDVTSNPFDESWVIIDYEAGTHYPYMFVKGSDSNYNDVTFEYTKVDAEIIIQPVGFSN